MSGSSGERVSYGALLRRQVEDSSNAGKQSFHTGVGNSNNKDEFIERIIAKRLMHCKYLVNKTHLQVMSEAISANGRIS